MLKARKEFYRLYVKVLHGHVLKLHKNCRKIDILTICNIMLTAGFCILCESSMKKSLKSSG